MRTTFYTTTFLSISESQVTAKSSTKHKVAPSQETRDVMSIILRYEYELYAYIRQRFNLYKSYVKQYGNVKDVL